MPAPLFPFLDMAAQDQPLREALLAACERVLASRRYIHGPEVLELENELAALTGARFALACASGSDALLLALMALGVGPGDEVITTPFTFVATVTAIVRLGARPVFADIDPVTYNLDPARVAAALSPRTRAVIPVHLYGLMADLEGLRQVLSGFPQVAIVEDAAQAIGAASPAGQAGAVGAIGCCSFYPTKNLGGFGDGGLLTTADAGLRERLALLREHGSPRRYEYSIVGLNSRLDALQAALLRVKLPRLSSWTEERMANAARYTAAIAEAGSAAALTPPCVPEGFRHVFNQYVVRIAEARTAAGSGTGSRRDRVRAALTERGIPSEIYYPFPLHLQPAFANLGYRAGDFPESEQAAREVLALPISPGLGESRQRQVLAALLETVQSITV